MPLSIAKKVDQVINLIPLNSLIPTDQDRTIFKHIDVRNENTTFGRKRRNLLKKYDLSLWLPTVRRLEIGYTTSSNKKASFKHLKAITGNGKLLAGHMPLPSRKMNHNQPLKSNQNRPSLEELRERLAAKREALSRKPKVEKKPKLNFKPLAHKNPQPTKTFTNEAEDAGTENMEFGSFVFAKPIGETATKLAQQNKKGSKLKRIRQNINELKKNEKIVNSLEGKEKFEATHQQAMKKALQKVQGKKVVDNLKTLKKSERSIKNKKQKSIKKWKSKKKS